MKDVATSSGPHGMGGRWPTKILFGVIGLIGCGAFYRKGDVFLRF